MEQMATVKYQVATYKGDIEVTCYCDDSDESVIAKAKLIVTRKAGGSLPFGYESWIVEKREDIFYNRFAMLSEMPQHRRSL